MGAIYVDVTIRNPAEPQRSWTGKFLVDTSMFDSLVPRSQLEAIGLKPRGRREYVLADGKSVSLDITTAEIEFEGEVVGGTVVYGDDGAEPLLGTTALDSGGFEVDPRNEELKRLPAVLLKSAARDEAMKAVYEGTATKDGLNKQPIPLLRPLEAPRLTASELCVIIRVEGIFFLIRCFLKNFGIKSMREQDIERYLHHILKSLKPTCLSKDDEEDILQEGRQAYWAAERNFDNTKNCKLTTYAYSRVRGAMIRMIGKIAGPVHLSEHSQHNGKNKPTYFRLDADEHRDGDIMPEQFHINESEQIDMRLDTQRILDKLSSKDRILIERYYGIGRQQYTFEEIAQLEGLSRAAVHKRYKRIILDVRNQLKTVSSN